MDGPRADEAGTSGPVTGRWATPRAEVAVDAALVRGLLADQHPDLADLPLAVVPGGWDNVLVRVGDDLAARLPRRAAAVPLVAHEQRWLPGLAARLPLPVPAPVRIGAPGRGYPWPWSVVAWLPGRSADVRPPRASEAATLGRFLRALHVPAPADAPRNPFRGVALAQRDATVRDRLADVVDVAAVPDTTGGVDVRAVLAVWDDACAAPPAPAPTWLHGDLHPRNVLVDDAGRTTGVIDWGDLCAGDPATDLAAAWMLFGDGADACWEAYGAAGDDDLRRRARGWAVLFGAVLLSTGLVDDPPFAAVGRRTLAVVTG